MSIHVRESVKGRIVEMCLMGESMESILSMYPIANAGGDVLTAEEVWKIALANGDAAGALMNTEESLHRTMSDGDSYELGQRLASDCMDLIWAKHDEIALDRGSKLTYEEQLGIMEGLTEYLQTILHMAKDAKRKEADKVRT